MNDTNKLYQGDLFIPQLKVLNFLIRQLSLSFRQHLFSFLTFSKIVIFRFSNECPGLLKCSPVGSLNFETNPNHFNQILNHHFPCSNYHQTLNCPLFHSISSSFIKLFKKYFMTNLRCVVSSFNRLLNTNYCHLRSISDCYQIPHFHKSTLVVTVWPWSLAGLTNRLNNYSASNKPPWAQ